MADPQPDPVCDICFDEGFPTCFCKQPDPVEEALDRLLTNGYGERAIRLQLRAANERDLGGWGEAALRGILRAFASRVREEADRG